MRVQVLENSRGICPTISPSFRTSRHIYRVDYQALFYKSAPLEYMGSIYLFIRDVQ